MTELPHGGLVVSLAREANMTGLDRACVPLSQPVQRRHPEARPGHTHNVDAVGRCLFHGSDVRHKEGNDGDLVSCLDQRPGLLGYPRVVLKRILDEHADLHVRKYGVVGNLSSVFGDE